MKPLPLLVLLVAATGLILQAPGVGEAHRFELMLAVLAGGGLLGILRGLDVPLLGLLWDEYGERRVWVALCGAAVIVVCLALANWNLKKQAQMEQAARAHAAQAHAAQPLPGPSGALASR